MANIEINTVFNINLEFESAPLGKRIIAYAIDFLVLAGYLMLMKTLLYDAMSMRTKDAMGFDMLIISLPMLLYPLITENMMNGQTIGKRLMHIRVISMDGGEPTFSQYIFRWITRFFEWPFVFGYIYGGIGAISMYAMLTGFAGLGVVIIIAVTKYQQRLGDILAGTVVVNAKTDLSVNDTVFRHVLSNNYQVMFPQVMQLSDNDINTIKTVLVQTQKGQAELAFRVEDKIKEVLKISSQLHTRDFLEKLIDDYNYLATREK